MADNSYDGPDRRKARTTALRKLLGDVTGEADIMTDKAVEDALGEIADRARASDRRLLLSPEQQAEYGEFERRAQKSNVKKAKGVKETPVFSGEQ